MISTDPLPSQVSSIEYRKNISSGPTPSTFRRAKIDLQSSEASEVTTVLELIDFNATYNPGHRFCIQALRTASGGPFDFLSLTHAQLKLSIQQCSDWCLANVSALKLPQIADDGTVCKGPPVALLMSSEVSLFIHVLSLISLGVPVLLLSARLSPSAILHLLNKTSTRALISTPQLYKTVKSSLADQVTLDHPLELYECKSLGELLAPARELDLERSICTPGYYINEADRNVLILHSSGTTGLPKPIYTSHKHLLCFTVCHDFSDAKEVEGVNVSTLPLYHGFGLVTPFLAMGVGKTFCLPPPNVVPTGTTTVQLIKATGARALMSVPSILEEICTITHDEGVKTLGSMQFVAFGGGLLKPAVGEKLATAGVRLLNHYGTTESGPLAPIFVPDAHYDWHYFRLRKDMKLRIEPVAGAEDGVQRYKLTTYPFGWGTSFEIQDQLISNPNLPMTDFNAIGRTDDLIVLATGEKVLPRILETVISESADVKAAVAFGDSQFELGVIVEPAMDLAARDLEEYRNRIWNLVTEANIQMDRHARISSKDLIIIMPPRTRMPRTDKGSISRKEVYRAFEVEIKKVYKNLEESSTGSLVLSSEHLEEELKELIQVQLDWRHSKDQWTYSDDLFELGMDSLQALRLRRILLSSVVKSPEFLHMESTIGRDFVYQHPSINKLANALRNYDEMSDVEINGQAQVDDFADQFSAEMVNNAFLPVRKAVILLTGSTGSLGSHLLKHLAGLPNVALLICLNRARQSKGEPQPAASKLPEELSMKIRHYETNAASPLLGLNAVDYAFLRDSVTHILHCAWPMDFKMRLSSFQGQFRILQNLSGLALAAQTYRPAVKPRLLFISSVAVVGRYSQFNRGRMVPEMPMKDARCANPIGYGEAKLVCERMIERMARDHGDKIEASYARIGQLAGSRKTGSWNTKEHLASLLKSSQAIGKLPKLQGTLSWIPVDDAAEVLSDILLDTRPPHLVYHVENPVRQSWRDMHDLLCAALRISDQSPSHFSDWLREVSELDDSRAVENPAKALASFFQADFERMACGEVTLCTDNARAVSSRLQELDAVSKETVMAYVAYWKRVGYLA